MVIVLITDGACALQNIYKNIKWLVDGRMESYPERHLCMETANYLLLIILFFLLSELIYQRRDDPLHAQSANVICNGYKSFHYKWKMNKMKTKMLPLFLT